MGDLNDIARRIWGSYEHGDGAADDVRRVLEDAWDEGYAAGNGDGGVSSWDPVNPYRDSP